MELIKIIVFFLAYLSLFGFSVVDGYANFFCLALLFNVFFSLALEVSRNIYCVLLSFKKKKNNWEKVIYGSLMLLSIIFSVVNIFVKENEGAAKRYNEDVRLMELRSEKRYMQSRQDSLLATYNNCTEKNLTDGARGWRIEATALTPLIEEKIVQIKNRVAYLDSVGSELNQAFGQMGGKSFGKAVALIIKTYIGALAPLCIFGLGLLIQEISPNTDLSYLKFVQVTLFTRYRTATGQLPDDYRTNFVHLPDEYKSREIQSLLGLIAIKQLLGERGLVNGKRTYEEVGVEAANVINRQEGAFSKSYVWEVAKGSHDEKILKNRKKIKKIERFLQKLQRNLNNG